MNREEVQRIHYDKLAGAIKPGADAFAFGSEAYYPLSLRAPYEFCEKWMTEHSVAGKKFLDYGCGTGIHSIFPALRGAIVTGVDISPRSLDVARQLAEFHGVSSSAVFEVGHCEELPYPDSSFDVVLSVGTLSCLELPRAYAELARVCKPDGAVLILDALGHNPVMNTVRRLRLLRGLKTRWSVDHILKLKDVRGMRTYFQNGSVRYFDLMTLGLAPLGGGFESVQRPLIAMAQWGDSFLLRIPFFQRYAYKFVAVLARPVKR